MSHVLIIRDRENYDCKGEGKTTVLTAENRTQLAIAVYNFFKDVVSVSEDMDYLDETDFMNIRYKVMMQIMEGVSPRPELDTFYVSEYSDKNNNSK